MISSSQKLSSLPSLLNAAALLGSGLVLVILAGCTSDLEQALRKGSDPVKAGGDSGPSEGGSSGMTDPLQPDPKYDSGTPGLPDDPETGGGKNTGGGSAHGSGGSGETGGTSAVDLDAGTPHDETDSGRSCTPNCTGKQCGDDGCGEPCGTCANDQTCNADQQCAQVEFELENGSFSGSAGAETAGTGWTGTGFADFFDNDGSVTTTVSPGAGEWDIDITYATGFLRDLEIQVNGTLVTIHSFRPTGSWNSSWKVDTIPRVKLDAGTNAIKLATNGDSGPNLDKLTLRPSASYGVHVEAEDYDVRGCSGEKAGDGGTIVVYCYDGAVNTYTVRVPLSGVATFTARAATANPNSQIQVLDEGDSILATLFIPPKGWDAFAQHSVRLPALGVGATVLKLRTVGAGADINWWRLDQK